MKSGRSFQQIWYSLIIFIREYEQKVILLSSTSYRQKSRSSFHTMPSENVEIISGPNFSSHLWPADLKLVPGVGNTGRAAQSFHSYNLFLTRQRLNSWT
jgi:hypothetical protein